MNMAAKDLLSKKCIPCEGGTPPMTREEAEKYLPEVSGWELLEDVKSISRKFTFESFREAIKFVSLVAGLAEEEDHHPDILINYKRVTFTLTTHAIGGLSENDFILAAKINNLFFQ